MSRWTDDDSDDLDRQVMALREAEHRERNPYARRARSPVLTGEEAQRAVTAGSRYISALPRINSGGRGRRGGLNMSPPPAPLHPALVVPADPAPKRQPEPPPKARRRPGPPPRNGGKGRNPRVGPAKGGSGRWTARSGRLGAGQRTFDTEAEARAWLDRQQKEH